MLRAIDSLPAPGLVLVLAGEAAQRSGTGLVGVGGVAGAGVSIAESEEAEVVKSESLDSPTGMVSVQESVAVCAWLSLRSYSRSFP